MIAFGAGAALFVGHAVAPIAVTATLDGQRVLPHRVPWVAHPTLPASRIARVDFLVDGKRLWVAHHAPYVYGGGDLVTSFLSPGEHRFAVDAVAVGGASATDSVTARVVPSPPPPNAVAGTWKAYVPRSSDVPAAPAGIWRLVISRLGWRIYDTAGTGDTFDVTYPAPGIVEVWGGMAAGQPKVDGNGWCKGEPGSPARYSWTAGSAGLGFRFVSGSRQCGFAGFLVNAGGSRPDHWSGR
jgi:hypothetical protein